MSIEAIQKVADRVSKGPYDDDYFKRSLADFCKGCEFNHQVLDNPKEEQEVKK